MYFSQIPDKYDTDTEPNPATYETDITQKLCVKVEKNYDQASQCCNMKRKTARPMQLRSKRLKCG